MRKHDRLIGAVLAFLRMFYSSSWRRMCRKAKDERKRKGKEWAQWEYMANCVLGKLAGAASLRTLEMLTDLAVGGEGGMLGGRRMPDSNVHDWMVKASPEAWYQRLLGMVEDLHRRKMLEPVHAITIRKVLTQVLAFDGKVSFSEMGAVNEDPQGLRLQRSGKKKVKKADGETKEVKYKYTTVDVVRAVVASAAAPVCVGLAPIERGNEVKAVRGLYERVNADLPWLASRPLVVTGDARQGNKAFAKDIGDPYRQPTEGKSPGQFYVLKIKGNAGGIHAEGLRSAQALLDSGATSEATDDWHNEGHGRWVKREFFRVDTPVGLGLKPKDEPRLGRNDVAILPRKEWPTVRQILVVRQTQRLGRSPEEGSSRETQELRLLISNIKREDCSARDLLTLVRLEWQVEVHHNVLDLVMREDKKQWACAGNSPIAMATLNSMAANLIMLLRNRHLRSDDNRLLSYPQLQMLILAGLAGQRAFKVLQAQQKKALLAQLDSNGQPLPEEFTKQWSDADMCQLMLALKHLFTYVAAAACGAAKKVRLVLEADLGSGEVTSVLVLI